MAKSFNVNRSRPAYFGKGWTAFRFRGASVMTPDWTLLQYLRDFRRRAMAHWHGRNKDAVGRQSTVDLAEKFL